MSVNPYQPPQTVAPRGDCDMTLREATLYVAGTTIVAAILGCLVGIGIGTVAPEYYRFVFRAGSDADFHPAVIGGALGLLQGGGIGLAIGVLLVVVHYWYSLRVLRLRLKLE